MLRFCSLGSGSSGNATLIEASSGITTSRVLVDCGFTQRELKARLARAGLEVSDIDAIFVTHEHGDHIGCTVALSKRHGIPIWMSRGTWRAAGQPETPWPNRCRAWSEGARWMPDWGPSPDEPGCWAPAKLVTEARKQRGGD